MELRLRTDSIVWRKLEDDVIALDLQGSAYLRLNASGAFLWEMLAEPTTSEILTSRLAETYGIPSEKATRDVDEFIAKLVELELLE